MVTSLLKGTIVVLESPSSWVVELLSKGFLGGNVSISLGLENWVRVVFVLHGHGVIGESGFDVHVELGLGLLDEWAIDWIGGKSHVVTGNLLELLVNGSGLVGSHTNGPELLWSSSSRSEVKVGVNIVLKISNSFIKLVANAIELGFVSRTSLEEIVEVGFGSVLVNSLACLLSSIPLLEAWNQLIFDEIGGIHCSVVELFLNGLSDSTINEVFSGNGSGKCNKGGEFHIFKFNF